MEAYLLERLCSLCPWMEIGQREQGEEEQSETTSPPELQSRGCGGGRQDAPQPSPRPARRVLMRSRAINLALSPTTRCKLPSPFASFCFGLFIGQRREKPQRVAERLQEASPVRGTCIPALVSLSLLWGHLPPKVPERTPKAGSYVTYFWLPISDL